MHQDIDIRPNWLYKIFCRENYRYEYCTGTKLIELKSRYSYWDFKEELVAIDIHEELPKLPDVDYGIMCTC